MMTQNERVGYTLVLRKAVRVAITLNNKHYALKELAILTRDAMEQGINPTLLFMSDKPFADRVKEGSV